MLRSDSQPSFAEWMSDVQAHVEGALDDFLPPADAVPERLHQAMRYAVLDGGKRVRPLLVFAAAELGQAPHGRVLHAAAAVEMIHAYSLVHDDMPAMDNDVLRRGKPTVHVAYGEAQALLVGDALQSQAFSVLARAGAPAPITVEMIQVLADASGSQGMAGGQAIDLLSVGVALSRGELEAMHRKKTGALLHGSIVLGALCGEIVDDAARRALFEYALAIGLAFQVVDDILDVEADSASLGKTAGKDAAQNKPTYVSLLGLEASRTLAEELRLKANAVLEPFGERARRLRQLADFIVLRRS